MTSPKRALPSSPAVWITFIVAMLIGVGLGIVAAGDRLVPGDVRFARAVQRADGEFVRTLADFGNALGSTVGAVTAIVLTLIVVTTLKARPEAIFLAALLVLRLAATLLKPIFNSPRPTDDFVHIVGAHNGTGYPSGHSLTAAMMALGLAVLAWRHIPSRSLAFVTIELLLVLMGLVGWARIWTGAHWPSDVVGGFAFGTAIVAIGVIVLNHQIRAER